jgi:uncharacterized surface protein with fasciclin (FAS1) repeats
MHRIKLLSAVAAAALLTAPAALAQAVPATPATPAQPATPRTEQAPATPATPAAAATPATPAAAQANSVIDVLKAKGEFTTLLSALEQAHLTQTLSSRPAITIFAPTDAAFAALPEAERTRLLDPANAQELRNLLLYHVIVADVTTSQIEGARGPVATASGTEVLIDGSGDGISVGGATVVQAEMDASNGGVFAIDKVLNPSASAQGDTEGATTPAPTAEEASADTPPADETAPPTAAPTEAAPAPDGSTRPAAPGENAPSGQPASTVTTTAAPPVPNPTDGQVDDQEDPQNPAPTPKPN